MDASTAGHPILHLQGIRKTFGSKVAIESIDLAVAAGEVHAICGENGAGKSTLMNILAGIHQPDAGTISVRDRAVDISGPAEAARLGIGMVHQHFTLVPSMTVAENIFLGRQPRRWGGLVADRAAMRQAAADLIGRYGFELRPDQRVRELTVGQRQRVEIIKALAFDAEILILDEPTAVLTPTEVDDLMKVIEVLRDRGRTALFITHKLREVKAVADRVTVIRHGRSVGTRDNAGLSESEIADLMVGRAVFLAERKQVPPRTDRGDDYLTVTGLTSVDGTGRAVLQDVTFGIRPGEVLGIAGVEGNGQTELAEALTGLRPVASGRVALDGTDVTGWPAGRRRGAGMAFIPEDRLDRGLSRTMSVAENLAASNYTRGRLVRRGLISQAALRRFTAEQIRRYDIRGAAPETPVGTLSGGNMQKVVLARELAREPRVLVVAQPTRGVDIGASEFVHRQILAAAERGCAVLLISSELSEVLALSDRIGVMLRGRLVDVLDAADATETRLGLLMSGGRAEVAA